MSNKIRVLIVDDSALIRRILTDMLNRHPEIEVVGTAQDGSFVINKIKQFQPDIVTLDVEMRTTGGLEILPEIVKTFRIPVIMVSAHTERGAEATLKALELGAVDFVTKPQAGGMNSVQEIEEILVQKIIAVAGSRLKQRLRSGPIEKQVRPVPVWHKVVRTPAFSIANKVDLIAIGASTGGTEAIKDVLVGLPNTLPGIVIVQHMPPGFTRAFANRLNTLSPISVKEAEDGDDILRGTALVAPGSYHMDVVRVGGRLRVRLLETPPVNRHRPSVDVLFQSVAEKIGNRSIGVILTGMGGDGSRGMKLMYDQKALTVAQDEDSCVVFGMPKEAIKLGGVTQVLPLEQIAPFLIDLLTPASDPVRMAGINAFL